MSFLNWTPQQDKMLIELRSRGVSVKDIAIEMGRSYQAIEQRLYKKRMGIRDSIPTPKKSKAPIESELWLLAKASLGNQLTVRNNAYFYRGKYINYRDLAKIAGIQLPE